MVALVAVRFGLSQRIVFLGWMSLGVVGVFSVLGECPVTDVAVSVVGS